MAECCSGDVEMNSQLAEDGGAVKSKESCAVEQCLHGGEGDGQQEQGRDEEEEMSQDEADMSQDKDTVVASSDHAGDEVGGRIKRETEIADDDKEEVMGQDEDDKLTQHKDAEPRGDERQEEVMSQDEGDDKTQLTQHKDAEPTVAHGEEGQEGEAEETLGAVGGVNQAASVEEMASQDSGGSDSDTDSEKLEFPSTLEGFGYHFKDGIYVECDCD